MTTGIYPTYGRVPSDPANYTKFLQQYYPNFRNDLFAGKPYPVQPGQMLAEGDPGASAFGGGSQFGGQFGSQFGDFDPRQIMSGQAFQGLLGMGQRGPGSVGVAMDTAGPGLDVLRQLLGQESPLGSGRGALVEQQGIGATQTAGDVARRRIGEASNQFGRVADAEAGAFASEMTRFQEAGGITSAVQAGQVTDLQEQEANAQFRQSVANSLSQLGLGFGGLNAQDFGLQAGALGQAGQLESFARNQWAEIMGRLLQSQQGQRTDPYSVEQYGQARGGSFSDITNFPTFTF
jgi:hypothetical protein